MAPLSTLAAIATTLVGLSRAQTSSQTNAQCLAAGYDATQCGLCPYNPSGEVQCASYKAGFDNLPKGSISTYGNAGWENWVALPQNNPLTATTLGPTSSKNYGAIVDGTTGTIAFGAAGGQGSTIPTGATPLGLGQLHYFHYACAVPNQLDPPVPLACQITVAATCLAAGATDPVNGPFAPVSATLNYDPATINRNNPQSSTGMAFQSADFATALTSSAIANPQQCTNYTFSAAGTSYIYGPDPKNPGNNIIIGGPYPAPVILMDDIYYTESYQYNAPASCGNQGWNWAYYAYTGQPNPQDGVFSSYDPTPYKTIQPNYNNTYGTLGGSWNGFDQVIYNSGTTTLSTNNFLLNHDAYIFAPQTGLYTFAITNADDIVDIWVGSTAYSGWTRANANVEAQYTNANGVGESSTTVQLTAGSYTPVRVVFTNTQGPASFDVSISAPNGTVLESADIAASPYIVRYSCDGTTAPAFPLFGAET